MSDGGGEARKQPIRLIRDSAAADDFFGSHARVAEAIVSVVEADPTHHVVGLLGPWGSGKSTVIKLLEGKFNAASTPTLIFTYDAWLHQSDPPRRAFLEQFVAFLQSRSLATEDKWQEEMDLLNRRVEESETRTTPTLTTAGYLILLSLLFIPFGSSLVKAEWLKTMMTYRWNVAVAWGFPMGMFLTTLPILIACLFYYVWRPVRCPLAKAFYTRANWTRHRPPHEDESLLAIIANKHVQRQNNRVVKSPEPTTIEFQRTFRDLLHAAAREGHRLVIVVDNLDRLPDDEAIDMWTTIRSFFLGGIPVGEPNADGPSPHVALPNVILPIDDGALERIFAGQGSTGTKSFADSFMEKTFDVTFHVSRPVLSDWNAYLTKQMRFVFGEAIADHWAVDVGRIFEKRTDGSVTPRDLNRALNAIASLWIQWEPIGIAFPTVAYYAMMRKAFEENLAMALASPLVDLAEHDPEWQQSLAAIHYGVRPEKSLQILLGPKLRTAIADCGHEAFDAQVRIRGFERVLYGQMDAQDFPEQGLDNLCRLLARAEIEEEAWATLTWRRLRRVFILRDLVGAQKSAVPGTFDLLVTHCPVRDRDSFLGAVGSRLNVQDRQQLLLGASTAIYRSLLERWLEQAAKSSIALSPIMIRDERIYLDVGTIGMADGKPHALIRTSASADDLVGALMSRMAGDQQGDVSIEIAMLVLGAAPPEEALGNLVEGIRTGLLRNASMQDNDDTTFYILACLRVAHSFARDALDNVGQAGILIQKTEQAWARNDFRSAARLIALSILGGSGMAQPIGTDWGEFLARNQSFATDVDRDIAEYGGPAYLRTVVTLAQTNASARVLAEAIFARRVTVRELGNLDVEAVIADASAYLSLLPDLDRPQFVAQLTDYDGFWDLLPRQDFDSNSVEIFRLLIRKDQNSATVRKRGQYMLHAKLLDIGTGRWESDIRGSGDLVTLAAELQARQNRSIALRHAAFAALQTLSGELLATTDRDFSSRWFLAASLLSAQGKRTLLLGLREQMLEASQLADVMGILTGGGKLLLKAAKFDERADDVIHRLLLPLLSDIAGLLWMQEHSKLLGTWIVKAGAATRDDLARRLAEDPGGGHEAIAASRLMLSKLWKLAR